jgi:aspartyl-tRNA synthetase
MKRILKPAAILFLSTIIFTFTACSTSQISVNKKAMKAIDKIAIMKFDTPAGIKKKIAKECEEIGKLSGAQALLFVEVTEYKEEVRRVKYNEYDKKTKKNIEKEKDKKFFTFQLNVRLVSATTGDVILTLKNKYPESSHEMTSTTTMTSNRERILNQMGEDLKEVLKEKK